MERTTFLEHYRICVKHDGAPQELSRTGTVITYKAVDDRFGESVALKLIPIASIDPAARERVDGEASAAQKLNHVNIAKVFDFGHEDGDFVYVSEYVEGETLSSWVEEHGPMPADAVLRVALQIVEALSASSSHRLTHRAIQPSNLMIVAGTTAEGGWPFVKLMNFGLAGIKSASRTDSSSGELESNGDDEGEVDFSVAPQFASPEQLQHGTSDFRSEIYSLGATMYFLLSGAAPSAKVRRQQLRPFPKALRNLLAHMLRNNPDERPQDPVALAETIRECLLRVERRQAFGYRFGIPLAAVIPGESRTPRSPLAQVWFGVLAVAALLLTAAVVSAFLLPDLIPFWHRTTATDKIGVPIGVPDETSEPVKATSAAPIVANQPLTNASPALMDSNQNPSPNVQQAQTSNAQVASAPTAVDAASPNVDTSTQIASAAGVSESAPPSEASRDQSTAPENSAQGQDNSSAAQANATPQPTTASQSSSRDKKKRVASTSKRARVAQNSPYGQPRVRRGSMRTQFVGTTPDGRMILRLPSGRIVLVTPRSDGEDQFVPRRYRRPFIGRDDAFSPPPPFAPDYPPYD
jgi:serine/threonine protein kinase